MIIAPGAIQAVGSILGHAPRYEIMIVSGTLFILENSVFGCTYKTRNETKRNINAGTVTNASILKLVTR